MNQSDLRRRAVVIGVDEYADDAIPDLQGAANDAREIHETLLNSGHFDIAPDHFLLNEHATAANIRAAVSDLLWTTEDSDFSLLYFSGHGLVDSYSNGYIAAHDMLRNRPLIYGLRMQELRELMLSASANKRTILLMLDCCYSGIAADGSKAVDSEIDNVQSAVSSCLRPPPESGEGRIIWASSPKDSRSRESSACQHRFRNQDPHDHGIFTFHVLEGLDGAALNEHDEVTIGSLVDYVESALATAKEEPPQLYGSSFQGLSNISFGSASRKRDIDEIVAAIRTRLAGEKGADLGRAIERYDALKTSAPSIPEGEELSCLINDRLGMVRGPATTLLFENRGKWSERCEQTFDRLEALACSDLTCEDVLRADRRIRDLFFVLLEVCLDGKSSQIFVSYLIQTELGNGVAGGDIRGQQ